MTGAGTNTWIIGEPGDSIVIDPGPDEPEHLQRIAALVGGGLSAIVCAHAHPDHAPGAAPLKAMTGGRAPILDQPRPAKPEPNKQYDHRRTDDEVSDHGCDGID